MSLLPAQGTLSLSDSHLDAASPALLVYMHQYLRRIPGSTTKPHLGGPYTNLRSATDGHCLVVVQVARRAIVEKLGATFACTSNQEANTPGPFPASLRANLSSVCNLAHQSGCAERRLVYEPTALSSAAQSPAEHSAQRCLEECHRVPVAAPGRKLTYGSSIHCAYICTRSCHLV